MNKELIHKIYQSRSKEVFRDVYELFVRNIFFHQTYDYQMAISGLFGHIDCKNFLQDYFNIKL